MMTLALTLMLAAPEPPTLTIPDESVYVVQRRAYVKRGSLELTPLLYTTIGNRFSSSMGPGVAIAYHIRENLAIELATSLPGLMRSHYASTVYELNDDELLAPDAVDLKKLRYFGTASMQFSALYGKFDLYGHLIDYDLYASAGGGFAVTQEACAPAGQGTCGPDTEALGRGMRAPLDSSDHYKVAGNLAAGLRLFFADWIGLRLELRDLVYADRAADATGTTTAIRSNVMMMAGVSFLL